MDSTMLNIDRASAYADALFSIIFYYQEGGRCTECNALGI